MSPARLPSIQKRPRIVATNCQRTESSRSIKPASPKAGVSTGTIYTCPMHPQIRQVGPGYCPICGMTLEPVKATADIGENHELVDMTRRF
jgi:Heavy metal binding domain